MQHLETIWRRRRLVLTVGLLGSLAIAIWVWFSPPLYRAHASILLGAQRVSTPRGDAMADKGISSEMALLSSPALVKDTLRQIGGEAPPPAGGPAAASGRPGPAAAQSVSSVGPFGARYRRVRGMPPADALDAQAHEVAKDIETNRVEDSNVIEVAYSGDNQRWADNHDH